MARKPAAVSMPETLHSEALERAKELGLTFSAYVAQLIRDDMARGGSMMIVAKKSAASPRSLREKVAKKTPQKKYGLFRKEDLAEETAATNRANRAA